MNFDAHVVQAYTSQQVADIAAFVEQNTVPETRDSPTTGATKTAVVRTLPWGKVSHFMGWSQQWVRFFNCRDIGFDIYDMQDLDLINYNCYSTDRAGEYEWHVDSRNGAADIKITETQCKRDRGLPAEPGNQ